MYIPKIWDDFLEVWFDNGTVSITLVGEGLFFLVLDELLRLDLFDLVLLTSVPYLDGILW